MRLYYKTGACSLAPHIVLKEAGLPFELVKVDTRAQKLPDGSDYSAVNSKGYVPVLELDGGARLTEAAVILQYLADLAPGAGLLPLAGSLERVRVQEWLNYIATELHKAYSPIFSKAIPEEWKPHFRDVLGGRLDWLEKQLAGRTFLEGSFTVADAYLFTVLRWTPFVGLDFLTRPNLDAYLSRLRERPAIRAAMDAEGVKK